MKIALSWLQDHIDLPSTLTVDDIAHRLTMLGLEVESVARYEQVPGSLQGVVVGRVLTCTSHPNADRLRVTTVDIGTAEPAHIVCGAPNVAAGQKVAVATVGTTLHPFGGGEPITLKKTKIRGETSEGMICAEDELGLGTDHDGILVLDTHAAPGTPITEVIELHTDWVFEIGLTPNRTDAISHRGVARDLAASLKLPLKPIQPALPTVDTPPCPISVTVESTERCPRYSGLVIDGLTVQESPAWLRQRLLSIGARPINAVVDATNYVMFDTGQPLHAFDRDDIADNKLLIRTLPTGTTFTSLFGDEVSLHEEDLMIADSQGGLCVGGVLGGKRSGVTDKTTRIFLESAWFDAVSVRQSKRRHGFYSESAYRFERGIDPENVVHVLHQAARLIVEICGGQVTQHVDIRARDIVWQEVIFDMARARTLMGKAISDEEQTEILKRLDIEVLPGPHPSHRRLRIPPYRHDVTRFEDVVEEVLRIYGYNEVADAPRLNASVVYTQLPNPNALRNRLADRLAAQGWYECVSNSLVAETDVDGTLGVAMANPLSEENAWLRTSLLPNLLMVAAHNLNRQQPNLRLFDFGKVYQRNADAYTERMQLGLLWTGSTPPEQWGIASQMVSFFDLKGTIADVLQAVGVGASKVLSPTILADDPELAYGTTWQHNGTSLVRAGLVAPALASLYDVKVPVYVGVLEWDVLESLYDSTPATFEPLPSQPAVRRDISLQIPAGITYQQVEKVILRTQPIVQHVRLFDVFEKDGQRSYTLALILQEADKTLTDKQIEKTVQQLLEKLNQELGVVLRG